LTCAKIFDTIGAKVLLKGEYVPIIRVENWPLDTRLYGNHSSNEHWKQRIAQALRRACVKAGVPGIDSVKSVTVVFGGQQALYFDRTLPIIVEGLFAREDRTLEVRQRLAQALGETAKRYLPVSKKRHEKWKVEALIMPFNAEVNGFWSG